MLNIKSSNHKSATTLEDLARITGFSIATVSRVIHNKGIIKPSTKEIIDQAVLDHNYRVKDDRKPYLKNRTKRKKVYFLVPDSRDVASQTTLSKKLFEGIKRRTEENKVSIEMVKYGKKNDLPESIKTDKDALLIIKNWVPSNKVRREIHNLTTVQCLETPFESRFFDTAEPDIYQMGEMLYYHLMKRNISKLFMITTLPTTPDRDLRIMKVISMAKEFNITTERLGINSLTDLDTVASRFEQESDLYGIFLNGSLVEIKSYHEQLYAYLLERGLNAPIYCNSYGHDIKSLLGSEVSYFDLNVEKIGEAAYDLLIWRNQNPRDPMRRVLVTPTFYA